MLINHNNKSINPIKESQSLVNNNQIINNLLAGNQQLINEEPDESESQENSAQKIDEKDMKKSVPAVFDVSFNNKCIGVAHE